MNHHKSKGNWLFDCINHILLLVYGILTTIPIIYVISGSLASAGELAKKGFVIIPTEISFEAYKYIFSTATISRSFAVTVYITLAGTAINIIMTTLMAYPLAHKSLVGRKTIMALITFTLLFGGGMIPSFILVKSLHLMNTFWALLLPGAISTWNLIVMKNFFQQIPMELEESAKIDGCNELLILFKIVLPLSAPALATFSLFYAVGHWNSFFSAILYLNDDKKWPIQVILRQILMLASKIGDTGESIEAAPPSDTVKLAVIVVATVPILLVYPFLQKHFVKGMMMGSIKG